MYQDIHFYIDLNWEHYVEDVDYFKKVQQSVSIAYQYQATVFYSLDQVNTFQDIDSEFIRSKGNQLGVILENAKPKVSNSFFFEINFAYEQTNLIPSQSLIVAAIKPHPKLALISFTPEKEREVLLEVKSNTDFQKFDFEILRTPMNVSAWINSISTRIFNVSDKHGENGVGNWKGESVLLCDRVTAQEFLNTALPDFKHKGNRLFNFDDDKDTFIEFFYENALNQWHGFHITQKEWEQRVPLRVRRYFGK